MAGLLRYGVARVSITSCFARPSAVSRKQQPKARCSASPSNSANSGAPGGADWAYPGREGWTLGTRAPPKASLTDGSGKPINNTLSGVTLKYVEVIHWLFLLPPVFLSYVAYTSLGSSLQSFFIVAYPIIQAVAATTPMALHEYEGWQIAPNSDSLQTSPAEFGNQWLRQVALRYLLAFQCVGLMLFNVGTFGWGNGWPAGYALFSLLSVTAIVLGPKKASPLVVPWGPSTKNVIPLPARWFQFVFLAHAVVNVYAYAHRMGVLSHLFAGTPWAAPAAGVAVLVIWFVGAVACVGTLLALVRNGSYAYKSPLHQFAALAFCGYLLPAALVSTAYWPLDPVFKAAATFWVPSVLVLVGGFIEAGFAETVWDQQMHATAVFWLIMGFVGTCVWLFPGPSATACVAAWKGLVALASPA